MFSKEVEAKPVSGYHTQSYMIKNQLFNFQDIQCVNFIF